MKWNAESVEPILAWQKQTGGNLKDASEHFKYSYSALSQGVNKYKKQMKKPKSKYVKKADRPPIVVKPSRILELDIPDEPKGEPQVLIAIMPMKNLKQFIEANQWQS